MSRHSAAGSSAGEHWIVFWTGPGLIAAMKKRSVVKIDPDILSGTPCFAGTRVPVRALLDYLEGGDTLDEFLEQYPTVSRKQAVAFLEESAEAALAKALEPA
jgi:uncharacterized protein (DUF433 family)